jgi:hypothetical protein
MYHSHLEGGVGKVGKIVKISNKIKNGVIFQEINKDEGICIRRGEI